MVVLPRVAVHALLEEHLIYIVVAQVVDPEVRMIFFKKPADIARPVSV